MKKKLLAGITLLVFAVLLGAAYYFLYFIKTPAYAANRIRIAVAQHDTAEFEKYVDLDSVMSNAFDDALSAESEINRDNILNNPFAMGILHMLKPAVVDIMKREALEKISGEKKSSDYHADPVPDAMTANIKRRLPLDKFSVKDLHVVKKNDVEATISLELADTKQRPYEVQMSLEKENGSVWRLKKVLNLKELIINLDAEQKSEQAKLNSSARDRLDKSLIISPVKMELIKQQASEQEAQFLLQSRFTAKNNTERTITKIYYDIVLKIPDLSGNYSYSESFSGKLAAGSSLNLKKIKTLNTLLPDDQKIVSLDISKYQADVRITRIAFDDGTSIEDTTLYQ